MRNNLSVIIRLDLIKLDVKSIWEIIVDKKKNGQLKVLRKIQLRKGPKGDELSDVISGIGRQLKTQQIGFERIRKIK
jgi:hypothetical protein